MRWWMTMRREPILWLVLLASCSSEPPSPAPPVAAAVAHGDHNPHHKGMVFMHEDLHFEVVLDPAGRHRIYLTDAVRAELPASAASDVSITIVRPGGRAPEELRPAIDEFGESWVAIGAPVEESDSRAVVALTYEGAPYFIEIPFLAPPSDPGAADPHAAHRR